MGEYVEFAHSRADLMLAANELLMEGHNLTAMINRLIPGIRQQENDPATFPKDDKFTVEFLKNYDSKPVLDAAIQQGTYGVSIGENAVNAIWNYYGQEAENAAALAAEQRTPNS